MDAFAVELEREVPVGDAGDAGRRRRAGRGARPRRGDDQLRARLRGSNVATRGGRGGWSSMRELARGALRGEEAWVVGGAVRDELLGRPRRRPRHRLRDPSGAARGLRGARAARPFRSPSGTAPGGSRSTAGARSTSRRCAARSRTTSPRATSPSTRSPCRSPAARRSTRSAAARDLERAASAGCLRTASSTTTRCGCCARSASRTSSASGSTPETEALVRARTRTSSTEPAGERILDELRAAVGRRLSAARRARPARAARRLAIDDRAATRDSPRSASSRVFGEKLERLPISNELRPLRAAAAAGRAAGGRLAARDPPLPPRDRAVGARGAGVHRRRRARAAPSSRPRRTTRPSRCSAATSSGCRPAPRSAGCSSGSRRSAPRARSRRGRRRSTCTTPRGSGSPRRLSGSPRCRTPRGGARGEGAALRPAAGDERALDSGTGTGALAFALAPLVREVVAVDMVPEFLEEGGAGPELPERRVRRGRRDGAAVRRGEFDLAGSLRTLHHLPRPELARRRARPRDAAGGRVLVVDQIAPSIRSPRSSSTASSGPATRDHARAARHRPPRPVRRERARAAARPSSSASGARSSRTSTSPAARARSARRAERSRPGLHGEIGWYLLGSSARHLIEQPTGGVSASAGSRPSSTASIASRR